MQLRVLSKKNQRFYTLFNILFNFKFVFWVLFPKEKLYTTFQVFIKANFLRAHCYKVIQMPKNSHWTAKGGLVAVACNNRRIFRQLFLFFFKDSFLKLALKKNLINLLNLHEYLNVMNGFLISAKIYDFIFKCNLNFLNFFKSFFFFEKNWSLYYSILYLNVTVVTSLSILLILSNIFKLVFRIFLLFIQNLLNFFCSFNYYADKKSINA